MGFVIGYLGSSSADDEYLTVPFFQGLKETGYVEGQNMAVEYRWAENQYDRNYSPRVRCSRAGCLGDG
jgi:putative ABC transport system substrate-binding protein